jgi:hypothetical protein
MFRFPRAADSRDDRLTTPVIVPNKAMQRARIHSVILSGFSGRAADGWRKAASSITTRFSTPNNDEWASHETNS